MHPDLSAHVWPSDIWSSYYTPNRCSCIPKPHDPSTFDPSCIWTLSPAGPNPTEPLKHVYPSPPPTDSDPKHTVPLPVLCEDSPSHAAGTSTCSVSSTLLPSSPSTPLSQSPLTSHPSLPLSPPPSLPMVPHPLPVAPTDTDVHTDTDLDLDLEVNTNEPVTDDASQSSSSSPEEPSSTALLTPLSPIWDLPLDDTDTRPASTLEVSTLMSRSLVSPLVRYGSLGVQATDGDRLSLSSGSYPSLRDLDPKIESRCGQLCSLVVPPDGRVNAFSMIHTFFPTPSFDGSDGSIGHSQFSSSGDSHPFNLLISHTDIPHLGFPAPPSRSRPRLLLPNLEEPPIDTQHQLLTPVDDVDPKSPPGATFDMPPGNGTVPAHHPGAIESAAPSELFHELGALEDHAMFPSPLSEFGGPSFCTLGTEANSHSDSTDVWGLELNYDGMSPYSPYESDPVVVPFSPVRHTLGELHADDEDLLESSPLPQSPSRRSFSELPEDIIMNGLSPSPPQSPLLAGQPLLTLPGAEPDNSLIVSEPPVSEWASSPVVSPRGSGLGLFLPIQAASSNQLETSDEAHAIEPNLNFSSEAIARVDALEFEKLKSVRRRTWVIERKAKEDEVFNAKRAELLAGRLSVAPPVPSKLADFDERGGVSAGADADDTVGPPGEPAQLDESDEKTIRAWLLYTEAQRAKARHVRKLEKERGRELQALLRLKLGEDPDAMGVAAKSKPGKTAIVSMPQLVARMIMKRRDTPRPFSPRRHDSPYIHSPLSLSRSARDDDDDVMLE